MSENYGLTTIGDYTPNDLIAGGHLPVELPITIAGGTAALAKGTLLGRITASGKYKAYSASATDGSQIACAILPHDIAASTADVKTTAFVHGVFNKNAIKNLTVSATNDLQNNAIFVKEVY